MLGGKPCMFTKEGGGHSLSPGDKILSVLCTVEKKEKEGMGGEEMKRQLM